MRNGLAVFSAVAMLAFIILISDKSSAEQKPPAVHQYENKGIIGKLEECRIVEKQVTCYVEFKSNDLSEKGLGLSATQSVMYDSKSIPYKASAIFLVNEERTDDKIKKKIAPSGTAEGRVVFNNVAPDTERISELIVHTFIHAGHGVWGQHPFKFYNINLAKQKNPTPR